MRYITIEELKRHLNVDADMIDEDRYIEEIGNAAEQAIEQHLQRPLTEVAPKGVLVDPVKHAIKLMAGTLYANRESVTYGTPHFVPGAFGWLLTPYIKF